MTKEKASRRAGSAQTIRILLGDSSQRMLDLPDGELAAVVCDPPYG